jgi:charged multivesicular body protein 5
MKRVFGQKKGAGPPPPSLSDASTGIGKRVDELDFKIKNLDAELLGYKKKIQTLRGPAKTTVQKRAMEVLKRRKMYEQQRDQLTSQQFNVDSAAMSITTVKDTMNTVAAMKGANLEFKKQMKQLNINDVEDVMDDMADLVEDMNEVNEIMGRSYAMPDHIDEAELEAELDILGEELMEEEGMSTEIPSTPYMTPSLPVQPTSLPSAAGRVSNSSSSTYGTRVDEFGLPIHS